MNKITSNATIKVTLSKTDEVTGLETDRLVSFISIIYPDDKLARVTDRVLLRTVKLMISEWQKTHDLQPIQPIEITLTSLCVLGWNIQLTHV